MKEFEDYYLGLDIGTDSVGWAVTDEKYNILQFKNKAMWGIHLFESGQTAAERRTHRTARRRLERRKQRIKLLRGLFSEEISKVDMGFFDRLDESWCHLEDRNAEQMNTLFNDHGFTDKEYHKKYPTIYHLRMDMMNTKEKPDIRLVYLAIHHIIKYRGHFLFKGLSDEDLPGFDELLDDLLEVVNDECNFTLNADNTSKDVENTITDEKIGVRDKGRRLQELMGAEIQGEKELLALIAGSKVDMGKLFDDEIDLKFSFRDSNYEDSYDSYADTLGPERIHVIDLCKSIYDRSVLARILGNYNTVSEARVEDYERHKVDLKTLKWAVRTYVPKKYFEIFRSEKTADNYCAYVKEYGKRTPEKKSCTQEAFCKYLKKIFSGSLDIENDPLMKDMFLRLDNALFMPKQTVKENSVIPYSLHRKELKKILDNASKYYPFLNETDEWGSVLEKILKINEFRIPYYVGPLNSKSDKSWVVRRSKEKITPWNFDRVVDMDESAVEFIKNLTNTCEYLYGEKVLPKNSLLYSKYELYNELNIIQINGKKLEPELKRSIVKDMFENVDSVKKVTTKNLRDYLKIKGLVTDSDEITGIDKTIKASLRSYVQIKKIIDDKISDRMMTENIIKTITIFGDERSRVSRKLKLDHGDKLTDDEIKKLSGLQFKDWGKFSEKLLTGLYSKDRCTGTSWNIMTYLELTENNFMQILYKYDFLKQIDEENKELVQECDGIDYKLVDEMAVSPSVKRGTWRALDIIQDILKVTKKPPMKIFVETTRVDGEKGKRTESRKEQLEYLYKACKKDLLENEDEKRKWMEDLDKEDEGKLKGRSLFLYYLQQGKCMYCSKPLNISDLGNNEAVDRDHLFPQSKIKDDSVRNNMVLVCRECNQKKGDRYPLSPDVQKKQHVWWEHLKDCGFVTPEKYARLIRTTDLTEEELTKFLNRQLVETSQSVKGVITVLKRVFEDTDIVYVKGRNVSEFRSDKKFTKCRIVNDYHHAKDAYLNIVVGNVYDAKFTKDPKNFLEKGGSYNIKRLYDFDVSRDGKTAWIAGEEGTLSTVRRYMRRNNIRFTRFATESKGGLFDQNLLKAKETLFRPKEGLDPGKYGGYDNVRGAYFVLVEYEEHNKKVRMIRHVPVHLAKKVNENPNVLKEMIEKEGFLNPRIVIDRIKFNSLLQIGDFQSHISGRTGNNIILKCGMQLILPDELYEYCKKISKYIEDRKNREIYPISSYKFTTEENEKLYDALIEKAKGPAYKIMLETTLAKNMVKQKDPFMAAEIDVQARVLNEVLHSFQCKAVSTDLKEIGSGKTGIMLQNMKISDSKFDVMLIHQSPTGLFERKVDLKKI